MKKAFACILLALAPLAFADITVTDVKGRSVTVPGVPERVVLGFYYEDYLAVAGPGAADKLVGLSLSTWRDWRPRQFALYEKALRTTRKTRPGRSCKKASMKRAAWPAGLPPPPATARRTGS